MEKTPIDKVCGCSIKGRCYPMDEEDSRVNMKMASVSTSNGFFRMCLECNKPLYLRSGKGPYD